MKCKTRSAIRFEFSISFVPIRELLRSRLVCPAYRFLKACPNVGSSPGGFALSRVPVDVNLVAVCEKESGRDRASPS
ncbi:MAG: hypothetical protein HN531_05470 [Opitutae bacterium]|nr:hypothetical protein [Opitutae bacterium]